MLNFGGVTFRHFSHGQRTSPQFAGGKPHLGGHSSPLAASRSDGFFCAEKIGAPRKTPGIFQLTLLRSIWFFWCQCLIRSFRWILGIKQSRSLITSVIMSTCLFWKMEFVVECLSWQNFCAVFVWLLNHEPPFNFLTVFCELQRVPGAFPGVTSGNTSFPEATSFRTTRRWQTQPPTPSYIWAKICQVKSTSTWQFWWPFVGLLSHHLQRSGIKRSRLESPGRWFQPIAPKFWIKNEMLFETTT